MISLKEEFDTAILKHLSTVDCAVEILENTTDSRVAQADLVSLVSHNKKISKESVNGTLWGGNITPRPHKLLGRIEFKRMWYSSKLPNGRNIFIKIGTQKIPKVITYDTINKQHARANGAEKYLKLSKKKNPIILTMASEYCHDVKQFININPNAIIYNVENNINVMNTALKQKLKMTSYYGDLGDFIDTMPNNYFDIINYDTDGYISKGLHRTLEIINRKRAGKYVCITLQAVKKFRNHGNFAENLRKRYDGYSDPSMEYLRTGTMQNYKIIDSFEYNRKPTGEHGRAMRVIVYKLKC